MSSSERLRRTLVHSRESSFGLLASLVPDTLAYAASPSPLRRRLRPAHDVCASTARYPCAVCAVSVWQRLPCTLPLYLRCSPLPAPPSALLPPSPCHRSSVQLPSSSPPSPSGCHAFPRALPPHHRPRPLCPRCLIFCPPYPPPSTPADFVYPRRLRLLSPSPSAPSPPPSPLSSTLASHALCPAATPLSAPAVISPSVPVALLSALAAYVDLRHPCQPPLPLPALAADICPHWHPAVSPTLPAVCRRPRSHTLSRPCSRSLPSRSSRSPSPPLPSFSLPPPTDTFCRHHLALCPATPSLSPQLRHTLSCHRHAAICHHHCAIPALTSPPSAPVGAFPPSLLSLPTPCAHSAPLPPHLPFALATSAPRTPLGPSSPSPSRAVSQPRTPPLLPLHRACSLGRSDPTQTLLYPTLPRPHVAPLSTVM